MIVFAVVWFSIGWQAIVILGGMSAIPPSVFEAAVIDGARYWQRAFKIVVPMLVRVLEFCIIASGVWTLTQLFPFLFAMTQGGPGYETTHPGLHDLPQELRPGLRQRLRHWPRRSR